MCSACSSSEIEYMALIREIKKEENPNLQAEGYL